MLKIELADSGSCGVISEIIAQSFMRQAQSLGIKKEEYPNYVAFETASGVQQRLHKGDRIALICLQDKPVGTISFNADAGQINKGYIKRLAVLSQFRGNGYGERLMDYAETRLKKNKVARVELSIAAQYEGLQRYYQRLGYVPREKKFFRSLPFEVLFMEKWL